MFNAELTNKIILFFHLVLRLAVTEITPRVLTTKKWFQFLLEAPVMLTGKSALAYQVFLRDDLGA